jgi:hypothetical protein
MLLPTQATLAAIALDAAKDTAKDMTFNFPNIRKHSFML